MITLSRRGLIGSVMAAGFGLSLRADNAVSAEAVTSATPQDTIASWYALVLELVRHTSNYSPPVASRAFGYLGVTVYACVATATRGLVPLDGQLTDLTPGPQREQGAAYDDAAVLHAALCRATEHYFNHTGPTGKRARAAMDRVLKRQLSARLEASTRERSFAFGEAIAEYIFTWSQRDGGHDVQNMGFPLDYALAESAGAWRPTSTIQLQQHPLLPQWGQNRSFSTGAVATCVIAAHPLYSEDPQSAFFAEALEVYDLSGSLTPQQKLIARFWSDDPMLSPTPPGHWVSIALNILREQRADASKYAEVLALLGMTLADAFIACWHAKYAYNLLRPVTYIRKHIDLAWTPLLITPPFPEYPSGHSVQSGAAAAVLSQFFGTTFAFEDTTHVKDGLPARRYASFAAAADEAAMSRVYGGIHFRSAAMNGLTQGQCVGSQTLKIRTRKT
jgi:membrane-associated phospholipid phosphatase